MQVFLLILPLTFLLNFSHPFFVSITEIHHNEKEASLELTVKIFSDDLEKALEMNRTDKVNLGMKNEVEDLNEILAAYLLKNIELEVNGELINLNYLGKEAEMDATWIYLEVLDVDKVNDIRVKNTLLFNYQDSQMNIVHLEMNGKKKSLLLNRSEMEGFFSY